MVSVMRGYRYETNAALPTPDDYGVEEPSCGKLPAQSSII
jgi:hypothetical protein